MIYALNILMIILGAYIIGAASIDISDRYRATHPKVDQLTFGENTTPRFFVKGTIEVARNNGAPTVTMDWGGKAITFKPSKEVPK